MNLIGNYKFRAVSVEYSGIILRTFMREYPLEFFHCFAVADLETSGSKLLTSFSRRMLHDNVISIPLFPVFFHHLAYSSLQPGIVVSVTTAGTRWRGLLFPMHHGIHPDLHGYSGSSETMKNVCTGESCTLSDFCRDPSHPSHVFFT